MKSIIYRCGALLAIVFLSSIMVAPVHPLQSAQLLTEMSQLGAASRSGVRDAGAGGADNGGDGVAAAGEEV